MDRYAGGGRDRDDRGHDPDGRLLQSSARRHATQSRATDRRHRRLQPDAGIRDPARAVSTQASGRHLAHRARRGIAAAGLYQRRPSSSRPRRCGHGLSDRADEPGVDPAGRFGEPAVAADPRGDRVTAFCCTVRSGGRLRRALANDLLDRLDRAGAAGADHVPRKTAAGRYMSRPAVSERPLRQLVRT